MLAGRAAQACLPDCSYASAYPQGGALPQNSAVRILYSSYSYDASVTVDGVEGELIEVPEFGGSAAPYEQCSFADAYRIVPPPPVGAVVVFTAGTFDFEYEVTEADVTPPAALDDVSVDVHVLPEPMNCDSCDIDAWVNLWISLAGGVQDEGSAVVHNIYFTGSDDVYPVLSRTVVATATHVLDGGGPHFPEELVGGFCVTVRTFDLAGNEASVAHQVCSACRARVEGGMAGCDDLVVEAPEWTDADVVSGGVCSSMKFPSDEEPPPPPPPPEEMTDDSGGSEESAGEVSVDSCGCAAGSPGLWWGVLLIARRRRVRC